MNTNCPACDGPATVLGSLGHRRQFRCRDCGATWSRATRAPTFRPPRTYARKPQVPERVLETCRVETDRHGRPTQILPLF